jgi:hypothetical protein
VHSATGYAVLLTVALAENRTTGHRLCDMALTDFSSSIDQKTSATAVRPGKEYSSLPRM